MNTPNTSKITQRGWAFYDWANSSYALVINTALYPLYFQAVTEQKTQAFEVLGYSVSPNAAYSYSLTLSFLILVFLSPVLSAIASSRGNKLTFLKAFCTMGALSCMGLFFFRTAEDLWLGLLLNISASIGFYGSLVFYNAFLPEVADEAQQDALSARGFALGYAGSLIMLVISLVLVQVVADDASRSFYTRLCFFLTGCWWLGFAQYSFARLPANRQLSADEHTAHGRQSVAHLVRESYQQLQGTLHKITANPRLKWLLTSFFFYSVGMQTVFLIATFIGTEIGLGTTKMILTIMGLQIEAIIGALSFAWLVKRIGNGNGLIGAVSIWVGICLMIHYLAASAASNPNAESMFFVTAGLVGLVMGGVQSVSRSTYSKLLPKSDDAATFFGFYDVLEKVSIVVGTSLHGYLINRTGNTQASALALAAFFVVGVLCLLQFRRYEARRAECL
ncbi:MAG: MFS transporter [Formosimonas sp.]